MLIKLEENAQKNDEDWMSSHRMNKHIHHCEIVKTKKWICSKFRRKKYQRFIKCKSCLAKISFLSMQLCSLLCICESLLETLYVWHVVINKTNKDFYLVFVFVPQPPCPCKSKTKQQKKEGSFRIRLFQSYENVAY